MKTLVMLNTVGFSVRVTVIDLSSEDLDFLGKCHGLCMNSSRMTAEQDQAACAINAAFESEDVASSWADITPLEKQWLGRFKREGKSIGIEETGAKDIGAEKFIYLEWI